MIRLVAVYMAALLVLPFSSASAQLWTGQASQITPGAVTIDGFLDEAVWASPAKTRIDQSKLGSGVVDGDADCYVDFTTLWDTQGWYLGVWFNDDVHNAINSEYLDGANVAYDDDGLQILFSYNFDDAYADVTGPYWQGLYGRSLVKGFGNLDPEAQYAGIWGEGSDGNFTTDVWTQDQQRAKGWTNIFSCADGINYQYEARFDWSGELMYACGAQPMGAKLGFSLVVNDNDGGFAAEGQMALLPLSNSAQRWGALILSVPAKISPMKSAAAQVSSRTFKQFSFDPLGRRIAETGKGSMAKNMLIVRNQQGQAIRLISK